MPTERGFYGWKLVGALFSLDFLNLGFPVYGGAVIGSYMLRQIPMSRSTFGLGFTLLNLFVGLPATLVGLSIIKRGIRSTYLMGAAMICFGSLFLALYASKPWHYLLAFGVINGIGICFGDIVPASTAATRWFERYRGRAIGIALSGSGISGFIAAPLLDKLMRAKSLSSQIKSLRRDRLPLGVAWVAGWRTVGVAMATRKVPSPSPDALRLFDDQLRNHGSITLSRGNAEAFMAARRLVARPDPDRPGLVRIERATKREP